ncbi:4-hydroxyphenylacetate 3-monooxygenase, oxygenase component [Paenibacillus pini]
MPVKNGKQYIDQINNAKPNVWLRGEQVTGMLSEHKAFRGLMSTQADLYEMQLKDEFKDKLTYTSPETGDSVGLSFLQPKTKEELEKRRIMMSVWGQKHHGLLGRSPDYMNTAMMAYYAAADLLAENNPQFAENMKNYYHYCLEHDITLSHAFIQPHASRYSDIEEDGTIISCAAKVVDQDKDGIIVTGAFLLATQGVTADEILVYPPGSFYMQEEDNPNTFAFAVPNNLPGIKWICRESLVGGDSTFDYPLSSQFEEMDTLVIFDEVKVPWDRVFILGSDSMSTRYFAESNFHVHAAHPVVCRYVAKTEFVLSIILNMVESLDKGTYPLVKEQVTEVIVNLETLKALLLASEAGASIDRWGSMLPDGRPLWTANSIFPKIYPRMMEIIQLIGGSGIIMIPSGLDFGSGMNKYLSTYLKGTDWKAQDKTALFRLAWELSSNGFGGRQMLYERFFFGDQTTVTNRLYSGYPDKEKYMELIKPFLS